MKQWISLLLAMVLLFSSIPMDAMAVEDPAGSIISEPLTNSETEPVPTEDNILQLDQPIAELSNTADGICVQWNAVEGAETYQVFRQVTEDSWELLTEVTETSYLDQSAEDGVAYSYSVIAKNADVTSGSEQSAGILRLAKPIITVYNIYGGITIEWNQVEGAESYRVLRQIPGGNWEVLESDLTELSYTDTPVAYAVEYLYTVQSCNATGGSAYASSTQIIRIEQPAAKVGNRADGIQVTWNEVDGAESYNVYRKVSGVSWELLSEETDTIYMDTNTQSGVRYSYQVRAKNGSILSSNKHTVSILRLAQPTLKLQNIYEGVSVKWEAVDGAKSYRVYRMASDGSWKLIKSDLTTLSYTDTTAEYGETHSYSVRACNGGFMSYHHSSKNIIRIEQPEAKVDNREDGIQITWNEVDGAESYNVYRKKSGGSWKRLTTETGTSYMDTSAQSGVKYVYCVRSKNADTLSSNKHSVSILRLAQPAVKLQNIYEGVSIKWEAVDGAKSYQVYRMASDGSWKLLKSGLTTLSYTDTTAEYGQTYSYSVCAYNGGFMSYHHSSKNILRIEQPKAAVVNKGAGIQITWNAVEDAECYNVYRKVSGGSWKRLTTETGTSYMDSSAQSGVTYVYCVRAKNGDILSSNKQSVTILRLSRPVPTAANGNTGVVVEWNAVEGAESYRILRKTPGGSWKTIASDITALKYTDTTAKSGTTYQYTVRSFGSGVLSGYIMTKELQYLSRPAVTAKTISTTGVKLQWKAVEGAAEYIVYFKTADTELAILDTVTEAGYTAENLTFGETYSFRVRAVSEAGRSTRSAAVSGKATYPAPEYTVELKPGKGIQISWTEMDGAASYRVYRRVGSGSWKTLKTTTSTSFVDTSGTPGVTYEYGVRAFELENAGGIYGIRATGKKSVYSKIDPSKPMVALTFDDGPSVYTKDILNQLEKYNAHATFFVVGNRVSSYASTIQRAYDLGCEIGNHSWSHPQLSAISVAKMQEELSSTDAAVKKIIGIAPELLRPPYGAVDADVKKYAGKPLIHWSIDTLDWSTRSSSKTISSVLNNVRDGSIVLMHDIYAPTRDAAVSLIPTLISRGYQLVTVSEMAAYRGVTLQDGTIYYSIR